MKNSFAPLFFALSGALLPYSTARADVKLPAIFSDGMIVQRGAPIPIWGTADAGEKVAVTLGNSKQSAVAGTDGKWMLHLPALAASSGLEMMVSGKNTLQIADVAVGEVWLASGQSNMELRVPRALNPEAEIASANSPLIRQFRVGRSIAETPQTEFKGSWEAAVPATLGNFTAVGYFFARELQRKLGVPVGIVHASYGGTPIQAWTSDKTLKSNPELGVVFENWAKTLANYPTEKAKYDAQIVRWKERVERAKAEGKPAPAALIAPAGPGGKATPSGLYNGMIAPVVPYGIKGVIWYQGESNSREPELYSKLFPALIRGWRSDWNSAELPFLWVQLANFHAVQTRPSEDGWALIREAQASALTLPQTGMVVTVDIGDARDIHYANKQEAGRRLALVALANQYGQKLENSGPQFAGMSVAGGAIRLKFTHAQGLKAKNGEPKGLAIGGGDGVFQWANAVIEGDSVVLSSPLVPAPTAARYAWADNPIGNLVNAAELPAAPFRTDAKP